MHPIRQQLNQLTSLNRTHKAILIEVCELAENGNKGACTATNPYLATRLGASKRTVSRTVVDLDALGLLEALGMGKSRTLRPSSGLRSCYVGDKNTCAINLDNLDKQLRQPRQNGEIGEVANLDKMGSQPRQNRYPNLDKIGSQPSQNGSRVYRDDQDDHKTTIDEQAKELASLRAALAAAQSDLALMTADRDRLAEEVTTLKAQRPASHTRARAAAELVFPEWATDSFRADWQEWVAYRQTKRDKLKPASLQKMLDKLSAFDEAYCKILFDKAISSGYTGLVFDDTPLKFAQYLQAQQQHPHVNGPHHAFGANQAPRYGQRTPSPVSTAAHGCSPVSLAIAGALASGATGFE